MSQRVRASLDELVVEHLSVVETVLHDIRRRLPAHVDTDELRSAGHIGLVNAAVSYDPGRGVAFAAYACTRVRGAILDELRSQDWATRSVRAAERRRAGAADALSCRLGREPSRVELARELGTTTEALVRTETEVARSTVLSLDALVENAEPLGDHAPGPVDAVVERETRERLRNAVAALPPRLREVVTALYLEETPARDVAERLGVTAARVSQMRREALGLLRLGVDAQAWSDRPSAHVPGRGRRLYHAATPVRTRRPDPAAAQRSTA